MSKKSTARTGSEGDAESTINDVFVNIRSESSSCKSKRELEGGPFGDSPCSKNQTMLNDFFILMFRNDDSNEASETSEVDQELYNLQNDYLEKLNSVRRTLNLLEISDDLESLSPISCENRCTITEIVDEETDNNGTNRKQDEVITSPTCDKEEVAEIEDKENSNKTSSSTNAYDVIKIYPSTETFKFESNSAVSIFELEYNPPKKKLCHRQRTPKLLSLSDGNLPYYTRIGLHDDLFNSSKYIVGNNDVFLPDGTKFIETKETQCTEDDFNAFKAKSRAKHSVFGQQNDVNLFPKVIVDRMTQNVSEPSSCSSQTSLNPINDKLSLNVVEELSDDSYTTYSTTIDSPKNKERVKKRFGRRNKVSSTEKLTLWEEIRKLHSPKHLANADTNNYDIVTIESKEEVNTEDVKSKGKDNDNNNDYIGQYLQYKKQMDSVKIGTIPFGTTVACKHTDLPGSLETSCVSRSPSMVNSDKTKKKKRAKKISTAYKENNRNENCLDKLCFCCRLKRN